MSNHTGSTKEKALNCRKVSSTLREIHAVRSCRGNGLDSDHAWKHSSGNSGSVIREVDWNNLNHNREKKKDRANRKAKRGRRRRRRGKVRVLVRPKYTRHSRAIRVCLRQWRNLSHYYFLWDLFSYKLGRFYLRLRKSESLNWNDRVPGSCQMALI